MKESFWLEGRFGLLGGGEFSGGGRADKWFYASLFFVCLFFFLFFFFGGGVILEDNMNFSLPSTILCQICASACQLSGKQFKANVSSSHVLDHVSVSIMWSIVFSGNLGKFEKCSLCNKSSFIDNLSCKRYNT